jgi:L-2-hydroxyglutarate oxidase LhgO
MTDRLDCVVVGAGVIGLAVGRSLAMAGREVVVLEAEPEIGMHTSSRNSEVIHAGIYYGENTLKAKLCVRGKEMLYRYCEERHIPFKRIGKLIVASHDDELVRLDAIRTQAVKNGVTDLRLIDEAAVRELEPVVEAKTALLSPSTGIIDSHSLMISLQADIEANGGAVLTQNGVSQVSIVEQGFKLKVDETAETFRCKTLINSAGLCAAAFAKSINGLSPARVPKMCFAKAHYFAYQGKSPFRHLVYPLPADGGLGVHATNDLGGSARFGPDVDWVKEIDYSFDESRKARFVSAIRSYFPDLDDSKLAPAYTGIRPKLSGPGEPAADFLIQGQGLHGVENLVNLFGIESPGLTASLAIGKYVNEMLS